MLRLTLAVIHLLALPIGLGAVVVRARALRGPLDPAGLRRVFAADNLWGLSALLFLGTGLWRLFGATEKSLDYYLAHPLFHAKLGLFLLIFALEIRPMIAFIRWRVRLGRGEAVDTTPAGTFARISWFQAGLVVVMVALAAAVARGLGR